MKKGWRNDPLWLDRADRLGREKIERQCKRVEFEIAVKNAESRFEMANKFCVSGPTTYLQVEGGY